MSIAPDELRKHVAAEARKQGEIDQDEMERRSKQGEMVTHDEIQTTANILRCRIVIYHARPAPGEPDEDIVSPEGNKTALRDIYMVLRSAHYTVLLNADAASQEGVLTQECVGGDGASDGGAAQTWKTVIWKTMCGCDRIWNRDLKIRQPN